VGTGSAAALRAKLEGPFVEFDRTKPNVARIYDYMLGGKDNFGPDQEQAEKLLEIYPLIAQLAKENRLFLQRAVAHIAGRGIRQFIDVGAGLPTSPNTHEIARAKNPGSRVAYVDNDQMVLSHTRNLLAQTEGVYAIPGDLNDPGALLASPALTGIIDLAEPVCVLLVSVLHFIDAATARRITRAFTAAIAPGSYLVVSAGTVNDPKLYQQLGDAYDAAPGYNHSPKQIREFFTGLDLVPPGLTDARVWVPAASVLEVSPHEAGFLAGVGRKPLRPCRRSAVRRQLRPEINVDVVDQLKVPGAYTGLNAGIHARSSRTFQQHDGVLNGAAVGDMFLFE
jgi:O-methyltransferase involved in polyketide biosynthesis